MYGQIVAHIKELKEQGAVMYTVGVLVGQSMLKKAQSRVDALDSALR